MIWNNYNLMFGMDKDERRGEKYLYEKSYKGRPYYMAQVKGKYVASGYDVEVVREKLSNFLSE